jgi:hypothetical protein
MPSKVSSNEDEKKKKTMVSQDGGAAKKKKKTTTDKKDSKKKTVAKKSKSGSKTNKTTKSAKKGKDGKKRYFKMIDRKSGDTIGRYTGGNPKQAGSKAFTKLVQKSKKNGKTVKKTEIFLKESTRNSPKKIYGYSAERKKLEEPQEREITDTNTGETKTITNNYRNDIKKISVPDELKEMKGGAKKKGKGKGKKTAKSSKSGKAAKSSKSGSKTTKAKPKAKKPVEKKKPAEKKKTTKKPKKSGSKTNKK